jgi:hypothetical protein
MAWSTNRALIDGNRPKKSKAPPALDGMVSATELVMVHLGDSSDQIWYATLRSADEVWTGDRQALALRGEARPAMAGGLMLFPARTAGGRLFEARFSAAGWAFNDADPEARDREGRPFSAHLVPSLARSAAATHLLFEASGSTRIDHAVLRGRRWQALEPLGTPGQGTFRTRTVPAVAAQGDTLHVVHLGESSNDIWHARGTVSVARDGDVRVRWRDEKLVGGQKSKASPAIAVFNGRVHMVHLGDSSSSLWHSIYIEGLDAWTQEVVPDQLSKAPPALAAFNGALHMVHLGESSNQIWWSTWGDPNQ